MKRFYVEFDNHENQRVCIYMYSPNQERVQEMLGEYDLILCDQTD